METIEERAREFSCMGCDGNKNGICNEGYFPNKCPHSCAKYQNYIAGAYQQDHIARAEEREECVRAAQDWYRNIRNEPKDSQWYDEVERDCVDLRNFIDHKRGSCDSYVTDTLYEEINGERERCIKATQDWYCKNECIWFKNHGSCPMGYPCDTIADIRKAMKGDIV